MADDKLTTVKQNLKDFMKMLDDTEPETDPCRNERDAEKRAITPRQEMLWT